MLKELPRQCSIGVAWVELVVAPGIWAIGCFVFTILAKAAIPIELGVRRFRPSSITPH